MSGDTAQIVHELAGEHRTFKFTIIISAVMAAKTQKVT
jgi:hypothetical protein